MRNLKTFEIFLTPGQPGSPLQILQKKLSKWFNLQSYVRIDTWGVKTFQKFFISFNLFLFRSSSISNLMQIISKVSNYIYPRGSQEVHLFQFRWVQSDVCKFIHGLWILLINSKIEHLSLFVAKVGLSLITYGRMKSLTIVTRGWQGWQLRVSLWQTFRLQSDVESSPSGRYSSQRQLRSGLELLVVGW